MVRSYLCCIVFLMHVLYKFSDSLPMIYQEIDREKAARLELERAARLQSSAVPEQSPITKQRSGIENGNIARIILASSSDATLGLLHGCYCLCRKFATKTFKC